MSAGPAAKPDLSRRRPALRTCAQRVNDLRSARKRKDLDGGAAVGVIEQLCIALVEAFGRREPDQLFSPAGFGLAAWCMGDKQIAWVTDLHPGVPSLLRRLGNTRNAQRQSSFAEGPNTIEQSPLHQTHGVWLSADNLRGCRIDCIGP